MLWTELVKAVPAYTVSRNPLVPKENIAQISYFVYCLLAPEKTIDAESRLEAA